MNRPKTFYLSPYLGISAKPSFLGIANVEKIQITPKSFLRFLCGFPIFPHIIPCLLLKSFILGTKVKRIFETIKFIMVHKAKK